MTRTLHGVTASCKATLSRSPCSPTHRWRVLGSVVQERFDGQAPSTLNVTTARTRPAPTQRRSFIGAPVRAANKLLLRRRDRRPFPVFELRGSHHHRRVIAGSDLGKHDAPCSAGGDRARGKDVVEAPADVPLTHVSPRWPPGEQPLIVGLECAADVHQVPTEQILE